MPAKEERAVEFVVYRHVATKDYGQALVIVGEAAEHKDEDDEVPIERRAFEAVRTEAGGLSDGEYTVVRKGAMDTFTLTSRTEQDVEVAG